MKNQTIIIDIDGVIIQHKGEGASSQWLGDMCPALLPGVVEQFDTWEREGACIVLMTARKECTRGVLEVQLMQLGLYWDQLVMGVTSGQRVLINDAKPNDASPSAVAVVLQRNEGLCQQQSS